VTETWRDDTEIDSSGMSSMSTLDLTGDKGYDIFLEPCGLSQHQIKYLGVSFVYVMARLLSSL
jgi:hypothetical protein